MALCKLCGLGIQDPEPPVYVKTIQKIECIGEKQSRGLKDVEDVVNEILEDIKDRSEAPQWMIKQAEKSIENQIKMVDDAAETARGIGVRVAEIQESLSMSQDQNISSKLQETAQTLDEVIKLHATMKNDFNSIKKRVDEESH